MSLHRPGQLLQLLCNSNSACSSNGFDGIVKFMFWTIPFFREWRPPSLTCCHVQLLVHGNCEDRWQTCSPTARATRTHRNHTSTSHVHVLVERGVTCDGCGRLHAKGGPPEGLTPACSESTRVRDANTSDSHQHDAPHTCTYWLSEVSRATVVDGCMQRVGRQKGLHRHAANPRACATRTPQTRTSTTHHTRARTG